MLNAWSRALVVHHRSRDFQFASGKHEPYTSDDHRGAEKD